MLSKGSICTDFLFARPSFISGVARVLDVCGTFDAYSGSGSENEADQLALATDWAVVGNDMSIVIEKVRQASSK